MSTLTRTRSDVPRTVTDRIVEQLERGVRPWARPRSGRPAGRPLRSTGEGYRGVNVLLLWLVQEIQGYASPYWLTYRQAEELGGHVRRGEHGYRVVYWNTRPIARGLDDDGNEIIDDVPFLKEYIVFNAGHPGVAEPHYHVILWYISAQDATAQLAK